MPLFTWVQHLYTFSIATPLFINFFQMFGRHRTPSAHPSLLMFCIDCPVAWISSSLALYWVPHSSSFTLAKRSWSGENDDTLWYKTPSFFMTMQGVTALLSWTSCNADNGRFWNIHCTHPIWVHARLLSLCQSERTTARNQWQMVGSKFGEATMWWVVVLNVYIKYKYWNEYLYSKITLSFFFANLPINPLCHMDWLCSFLRNPFSIDTQARAERPFLCHGIPQKSFYTTQTQRISFLGSSLQVGIRWTGLLA